MVIIRAYLYAYGHTEVIFVIFTVHTSRTTNEQKSCCISRPAASVSGGSVWQTG